MADTTPIEGMAKAIYDADGWHKTDGTMIPYEDVGDENPMYEARARAALRWLHDNETDEEIEAGARAICRAHRTGSGHQSEKAMQETEDNAWRSHIPDAKGARHAILQEAMKEN